MLQSLVITLREGVEAALILGIAIAYLRKSGRAHQVRLVFYALAAAILASLAGAALLTRIEINQEAVEGWLLLAAAFFVASLIIWMQATARGLKRHIEQRLETISSRRNAPALGLFLFVFLMVFREGVETVLLLSAVSLSSQGLLFLFGALVGLALAVVFAVVFIRGTVRLDLRRFFQVTTVILLFVVVQLVVSGVHELSEAHVLPSSQRSMAVIGPLVNNDIFFFITILALAALMVLFDWRSRQAIAPLADTLAPAERRQQLWQAKREKLWTAAVCGSAFVFILLVTAQFIYAKNQAVLSPAATVTAEDGVIRIPADSVSDGNLHRFLYSAEGATVRFIVLRTGTRLAAALDACVICGSQGYYQQGPNIFCKNCAAAIYVPSIGVAGGCNPIPLPSVVEGSELRIQVADLMPGAAFFHARE